MQFVTPDATSRGSAGRDRVQVLGDSLQGPVEAPMRGGASNAELPADRLPANSRGAKTHNLGVQIVEDCRPVGGINRCRCLTQDPLDQCGRPLNHPSYAPYDPYAFPVAAENRSRSYCAVSALSRPWRVAPPL